MANSQWFECQHGHKMAVTGDPKTLKRKAATVNRHGIAQIVCPRCKLDPDAPRNVLLIPCEPDENVIVDQYSKKYACKHGHVTVVYPFTTGVCNVSWGDGQEENVAADPETMMSLINERHYKCQDIVKSDKGKKRVCNCKLLELDNAPLEIPNTHGIKTKVRVGDVWDKNKCPRPETSHHEVFTKNGEKDARFVETEFSKKVRKRASDEGIWVFNPKTGKQEKIRKTRTSKKQGEVLREATQKSYKDGRTPPKDSE